MVKKTKIKIPNKDNKILQALKKAYKLIKAKDGWTQHTYARIYPTSPWHVPFDSPNAKCFCALGALNKVLENDLPTFYAAVSKVEKFIPKNYKTIVDFNDDYSTTQKDVVKVFKKAIDSFK